MTAPRRTDKSSYDRCGAKGWWTQLAPILHKHPLEWVEVGRHERTDVMKALEKRGAEKVRGLITRLRSEGEVIVLEVCYDPGKADKLDKEIRDA